VHDLIVKEKLVDLGKDRK